MSLSHSLDSNPTSYVSIDSKEPRRLLAKPVPRRVAVRGRPRQKGARARPSRKKGGRQARGRAARGPLSNISASSVSLQDAADFLGASWKYGSYALAMLNAEEKQLYTLPINGIITNLSQYYLSGVAQGDDYNERIGTSLRATNLRIDYLLQVNSTAGVNVTRLIVLRDLMNTGTTPTFSDVLEDNSSTTTSILSPYLHYVGDRFQVLYDAVHDQSVEADTALIHKRVAISINDHFLYQGTSAAVGSAFQGALFLLAATDQPTNGPKLAFTSTLKFIDN